MAPFMGGCTRHQGYAIARTESPPCEMEVEGASAGTPAPVEAHGAVVAGHAQRGDLPAALEAVQRFVDAGGTPDARMCAPCQNAA